MRRLLPLFSLAAVVAVIPPASAQVQVDIGPVSLNTTEPTDVFAAPTFGAGDTEETTDDLYVDLKDDASESDIADESDVDKLEVAHGVDFGRVPIIIDILSKDSRVEHVEQGVVAHAYFVPNDPLYQSKQWHLKKVGAESSWERS